MVKQVKKRLKQVKQIKKRLKCVKTKEIPPNLNEDIIKEIFSRLTTKLGFVASFNRFKNLGLVNKKWSKCINIEKPGQDDLNPINILCSKAEKLNGNHFDNIVKQLGSKKSVILLIIMRRKINGIWNRLRRNSIKMDKTELNINIVHIE